MTTQVKGSAGSVGAPFSNQSRLVRATYDFAEDGGADGALALLVADGPLLVRLKSAYVETAAASDGSATVDLGKTDSVDAIWTDVAVATLAADAVLEAEVDTNDVIYMADGDELLQTIVTADLTAGKFHYTFEVWKPQA